MEGSDTIPIGAGGPLWNWQRELEALGGRLSRTQAEDAAATRRAAEEAERSALRLVEEAERRQIRCHAEETAALTSFLAAWHGALEVRQEQVNGQLLALGQKISTEVERLDRRVDEAGKAITQAISDQITASLQEKVEPALASLHKALEVARQEVDLEAGLREASLRDAMNGLKEQLVAVEEKGAAAERGVADLGPTVAASTSRLEALRESLRILEETLAKQSTEMRSELLTKQEQQQEVLTRSVEETRAGIDELKQRCGDLEEQLEGTQRSVAEAAAGKDLKLKMAEEAAEQALAEAERASSEAQAAAGAARAARACAEGLERNGPQQVLSAASATLEGMIKVRIQQAAEAEVQRADRLETLVTELSGKVSASHELAARAAKAEEGLRAAVDAVEHKLATELESLHERTGKSAQALQECSEATSDLSQKTSHLTLELSAVQQHRDLALQGLAAEIKVLTEQLALLKSQGLKFEWKISKCLQRLRYLSLHSEPGLYLDSEPFHLENFGPLELRLFPKGLRTGDGQCALALRLGADAATASPSVPLFVDLVVGDLRRRVAHGPDLEGGLLWLAEGFGDLGAHTGDSDNADLLIVVEVPAMSIAATVPQLGGGTESLRDSAAPSSPRRATLRQGVVIPQAYPTTVPVAQSYPSSEGHLKPPAAPLVPVQGSSQNVPLPARPKPAEPSAGPSGVWAIRSSWTGSPPETLVGGPLASQAPLALSRTNPFIEVGKAPPVTNPFDEKFSPIAAAGILPSQSATLPPSLDAAR